MNQQWRDAAREAARAAEHSCLGLVGGRAISLAELPLPAWVSGAVPSFELACRVLAPPGAPPPLLLLGDYVGLVPVALRPREPPPSLQLLAAAPAHPASRALLFPGRCDDGAAAAGAAGRWVATSVRYIASTWEVEWRLGGAPAARATLAQPLEFELGGEALWCAPDARSRAEATRVCFRDLRLRRLEHAGLHATDDVRWPLDEGGGDVLREASGSGEPGCARGEFRWEPVDDVVRGAGIRTAGAL